MKKSKDSKYVYIAMCVIFVIALIVIALSLSYAFLKVDVEGEFEESIIETKKSGILKIDLDSGAINAYGLYPIVEEEIENESKILDFSIENTSDEEIGKYNIYLKDIEISNNFIDSNFKWEILKNNSVFFSGDFSDIEVNGTKSTTKIDTENTKYFDNYYLVVDEYIYTNDIDNFELRLYLLDDGSIQNNLQNGTFSCKLAVEGR